MVVYLSLSSLLSKTLEMLSGYICVSGPLILSFNICTFDRASKQACQELRPVLPALIKHLVHFSLVSHIPVVWCKFGNTFYVTQQLLELFWGLAHVY